MATTNNSYSFSHSYQISLLLIAISFIFLVLFSYNALKSQDQLAQGRTIKSQLDQIDKISSNFFDKLAQQKVPQWAIPMPMDKPTYPFIKVPNDSFSQEKLWQYTVSKNTNSLPLIEGEANSNSSNKIFWQFKLLELYMRQKEFSLARKQANLILLSSIDFLLPSKKSIKYEAVVLSVNSFIENNSPEAAIKWAYKLRSLPIPTQIPIDETHLIKNSSGKLKNWLSFLIWCFKNSHNSDLKVGWHTYNNKKIFLLFSNNSLIAYPGEEVITQLRTYIQKSGVSNLPLAFNLQNLSTNHLLKGSNGLLIQKPKLNIFKVKTSFFWLVILTSIGIIALFRFSILEWKYLQREQGIKDEEEFLKQTAHDLKTPLTSIQFLAETISLKRFKSSAKEKEYLDKLIDETNRATIIIDQMLYSVRLTRNVIKPDENIFSPSIELNYILQRFEPRLSDWSINIHTLIDCNIKADKDMWERVFINIIENAIKHASAGKVLDFTIHAVKGNDSIIEIQVGDRGPGLAIADKNKETSLLTGKLPYDKNRGGSGVGLHLIRQIMQLHSTKFTCQLRKEGGLFIKTQWVKQENDN